MPVNDMGGIPSIEAANVADATGSLHVPDDPNLPSEYELGRIRTDPVALSVSSAMS
jgi:hypothetical protein